MQPPKKEPQSTPDTHQTQMAHAFRNFQNCIQHCERAVFFTDAAGILQRVNPAFEKLTGYPSHESVGKDLSWMTADGPASESYRRIWQDIYENRAFRGTLEVRRRDGNCLQMELTAIPVRDNEGHITSLVCTGRDMRHEQGVEVSISEARKLNAIATLARAMAHDLNNTLMVIRGCAELALEALPPENAAWRKLHEIRAASQRACELASEMLALGRKGPEQRELVSFNTVIQETCKILPRVVGRDVQLQVALGPEFGLVDASISSMQELLLNIAISARDALPYGGKLIIQTGPVDLDTTQLKGKAIQTGRCARLSVSITATPRSKERGPRPSLHVDSILGQRWIREADFVTLQEIANENNASISLDEGDAQRVFLNAYFPVVEVNATGIAGEIATDTTETVLLVEEEAVVRTAAAEFLSGAGYKVLSAKNGQEAFEQILTHPGKIDLVITDIVVPQMSGPRLADAAVAMRPDTKILFLSGYADNPAFKKPPGRDFLLKPFSLNSFGDKIRELLSEPKARAAGAGGD